MAIATAVGGKAHCKSGGPRRICVATTDRFFAAHVYFGSKADISQRNRYVGFTPESRHCSALGDVC
jgi:hypothetical protein